MIRAPHIYVASAVRTAIGTFGGSLSGFSPTQLATRVTREAIERAALAPAEIETVVFGTVIASEARDHYLSRVAAVEAGIPVSTPSMNVNRLCGSGLQAIVSAAQSIAEGSARTAVAGGAECMSRAPHLVGAARFGRRMGEVAMSDALLGTLSDPFGHGHMGETAENVAERCGVGRVRQDEMAAASHSRAVAAIDAGRFVGQICPIEIVERSGTRVFDTDEHVRRDATAESLAGLRPAFRRDGTVTAGNASGINDGAAALVLVDEATLERLGLEPLARYLGHAHAGVDPATMGLGPVPAVRRLAERLGTTPETFDVIESNEAFASQACAVNDALGLDADRVNVNGGAIALGHPIGASGAIIATKALHELARSGARQALATMCIGGGQGIAVAFEAVR